MGKKLLVADDSLTIQKVIKLALSHDGYEIQTVADGNELIAQLSLFRPEVVLIDLGLPGRSAFDVKKAANESPDLKDIPFVLMASAFEKVDEAKVALLQFDGRLTKPFDPSHLRDVLQKAVTSRGIPENFNPADLPSPQPRGIPAFNPPPAPGKEHLSGNDPLWMNEGSPDLSFPETFPPSPGLEGSQFTIQPDDDPAGPVFDTNSSYFGSPQREADEKTDEIKLPPLSGEDTDIRHLTESTVKMSGLDDLAGWNINESSKNSLPPISTAFETDKTDLEISRPAFSSTPFQAPPRSSGLPPPSPSASHSSPSSSSSRADELLADLPTSKDIEDMVEKQVRAQLEEMIQKQVSMHLEKFTKSALPDLAEKIVKQEIRKLLEGLS